MEKDSSSFQTKGLNNGRFCFLLRLILGFDSFKKGKKLFFRHNNDIGREENAIMSKPVCPLSLIEEFRVAEASS